MRDLLIVVILTLVLAGLGYFCGDRIAAASHSEASPQAGAAAAAMYGKLGLWIGLGLGLAAGNVFISLPRHQNPRRWELD